MKKIIVLISTVFLATACGSKKDSNTAGGVIPEKPSYGKIDQKQLEGAVALFSEGMVLLSASGLNDGEGLSVASDDSEVGRLIGEKCVFEKEESKNGNTGTVWAYSTDRPYYGPCPLSFNMKATITGQEQPNGGSVSGNMTTDYKITGPELDRLMLLSELHNQTKVAASFTQTPEGRFTTDTKFGGTGYFVVDDTGTLSVETGSRLDTVHGFEMNVSVSQDSSTGEASDMKMLLKFWAGVKMSYGWVLVEGLVSVINDEQKVEITINGEEISPDKMPLPDTFTDMLAKPELAHLHIQSLSAPQGM